MSLGLRFRTVSIFLAIACSIALADVCRAVTPDPMDWPNWRGPQQNRVSMEKGLIEKWNPEGGEGSNVLWKSARARRPLDAHCLARKTLLHRTRPARDRE